MSKQTELRPGEYPGRGRRRRLHADAITYVSDLAAPGRPAAYVVKPYVEFMDQAATRPDLRELLNNADLAVPDGVALTWAAAYLYAGKRSLGRFWLTLFQIVLAPHELRWPLPDRAAGINFTWPFCSSRAATVSVCTWWATPKTAPSSTLPAHCNRHSPRLNSPAPTAAVTNPGPPGQVSDEWLQGLTNAIHHAAPDLVLVGMGFPLQERVCAHLAAHCRHGVFIGEGGTFDYEAFGGRRPKAPRWIQIVGLEWFWRLLLEPGRIVRQLAVPRFIWRVWRSR